MQCNESTAKEKGLMTVCITLQHCTRNRTLLKIVGLESRCFGSEVPGRFQCLQWLGKCILLLEDVKQHHDGNQPLSQSVFQSGFQWLEGWLLHSFHWNIQSRKDMTHTHTHKRTPTSRKKKCVVWILSSGSGSDAVLKDSRCAIHVLHESNA